MRDPMLNQVGKWRKNCQCTKAQCVHCTCRVHVIQTLSHITCCYHYTPHVTALSKENIIKLMHALIHTVHGTYSISDIGPSISLIKHLVCGGCLYREWLPLNLDIEDGWNQTPKITSACVHVAIQIKNYFGMPKKELKQVSDIQRNIGLIYLDI